MEPVEANLRDTVRYLAGEIGQRSYLDIERLEAAAQYIEERLTEAGCEVIRHPFEYQGRTYHNLSAEVKGKGSDLEGILVIGAHYDTVVGTPGADDNASGVAGLIKLARFTEQEPFPRTVRFVAFCLEEPPVFLTSRMGSHVYAAGLKEEGVEVFGMISLEMLGYYSDRRNSQYYPASFFRFFYPAQGDFIAFVGNLASRQFTNSMKHAFRAESSLPVESLNAVSVIPGVDFSDHRSFWKFGFRAFMVTDTAFYRNPNYHSPGDTPDTLDYGRMAACVIGLFKALSRI